MGEPGDRRISNKDQRARHRAHMESGIHQATLRALDLHHTVSAYELSRLGIGELQLRPVRSWNEYKGATHVADASSGLRPDPHTAYVIRGMLGVGEDRILKLTIPGDDGGVINFGRVKGSTADTLRDSVEVVAVARIDREPDQSGEFGGTIHPSVRLIPSSEERPQSTDELLFSLRSAVRTSEGRTERTRQSQRLPRVRQILGELRGREDLTEAQVIEVSTALSLLPAERRPVWGSPFDLQALQESIHTANQRRLQQLMGQHPPLTDLENLTQSQFLGTAVQLTGEANPPTNTIMRLLPYNFLDGDSHDAAAIQFLREAAQAHMPRVLDPERGAISRHVIDDVIENLGSIDRPGAAEVLMDITDRSIKQRMEGQRQVIDRLVVHSLTTFHNLLTNGEQAISFVTADNYEHLLERFHVWRMSLRPGRDRIDDGTNSDYLMTLEQIVTVVQFAGHARKRERERNER